MHITAAIPQEVFAKSFTPVINSSHKQLERISHISEPVSEKIWAHQLTNPSKTVKCKQLSISWKLKTPGHQYNIHDCSWDRELFS